MCDALNRKRVRWGFSPMSPIERCEMEIREAKDLLRAGHPDVEGLMMAVRDWQYERRLLPQERKDRVEGVGD